MFRQKISDQQRKDVNEAVRRFCDNKHHYMSFAKSVVECLQNDPDLKPYIQQIKYRLKSEPRLREKLTTKAIEDRGFKTGRGNHRAPLEQINDLAGIRILHLHTSQIGEIDKHIKRVLKSYKIKIVEGPIAHCWDRDHENLFSGLRIQVKDSGAKPKSRDSMYASVHYVLAANQTGKITSELQVRTLADELWAEVSHRVEYEGHQHDARVHEMLKVLARITSASSRLVDCIFEAHTKGRNAGRPRPRACR
jgi:ppGpp synthetase/RelA/SpoT-type nucleotidyltranferase